MNKNKSTTEMLNEQEIKIYKLVKNDIEYMIKEVDKYGLDALKLYVECVGKKIISLEKGGKKWN